MTAAHRAVLPGDTVEIGDTRYQVQSLHPTDEGPVVRLHDGRRARFVLASELGWDGGVWRPETEAELRAAWGDR